MRNGWIMLNSLSKFGSRINKSVKNVMDCSKREEADRFFFSSIFVGGLMGGYKMCSYFLVFDMQLLAAISDTFQRATQRIASKTGIKCSRLT